jgi:hypothetical protein
LLSRRIQSCDRRVSIVLILVLAFLASMALGIGSAGAAQYKMLLCAGNVGTPTYGYTTNTINSQHPSGIFDVTNNCGPAPDPAGESAWLRIAEHEPNGSAGQGAYGDVYYDTPPFVHFKQAGGYTREPNAFNEGWRARFWGVDFASNGFELMTQGAGLCNCGDQWATTGAFAPHLWPFGYQLDFWRFVFELECVRPAGCDRTNFNAADANTFVMILSDDSDSQVGITGAEMASGNWVRGVQLLQWNSSDQGSGLRFERVRLDGNQIFSIDYQALGLCNTGTTSANGEFARAFQPCPTGGPFGRTINVDTGTISDGPHTISVCTQDYAQYQGLNGTGSESCDARTIHTDNTPPGAPPGLFVTSANPQRYLDHFDANFSLPPNEGSPITAVHYNIVNAANEVVVPEKTVSAVNPTQLQNIQGPDHPGDYRLRVWLQDQVGYEGPAATAPIPHDTVPPGAPQLVSVTSPDTPRSQDGFDVRWHNIVDGGSPINEAHYQILNGAGAVVVPTKTLNGDNIQTIQNLEAPSDRGKFSLRIWLSDEEGNAGAPTTVPLSYECVRSPEGGGQQLTADLGGGSQKTVQQGEGATISGDLKGAGGDISGAPLCIFSNPVTDSERDFLGMAVTGSHGDYRFAIPQGPSRQITVIYRPDQRQMSATATLMTVVHPTFRAKKSVVENHHFAYFEGDIPGPHNNQVVIVLQVRSGKGWLAFRRYRTRNDGHFELAYRFNRTDQPTTYEMRAQVRQTTGYPYEQGNSDPILLKVVPDTGKNPEPSPNTERHRCPKGKRAVKKVVKRGHKKAKKVVCVKIKKKKHRHGSVHH